MRLNVMRAVGFATMLCCVPSSAQAWVGLCDGGGWDSSDFPVEYRVNLESFPVALDRTELLAAIQRGFDAWSGVSCSGFRAVYGGTTRTTQWGVNTPDGENIVAFRAADWPGRSSESALIYQIYSVPQDLVQDADIILNGVDFEWSLDGAAGTMDVETAITHEVGHLVGLGHTPVPGSVMNIGVVRGEAGVVRGLTDDDQAGACTLYPNGGAAPMAARQTCAEEVNGGVLGEPCTGGTECQSNICANDGIGRYCSRSCGTDADCGNGFDCGRDDAGNGVCVRVGGGGVDGGVGAPCQSAADCAGGGSCVNSEYCTRECSAQDPCPMGFGCTDVGQANPFCIRGATNAPPSPSPSPSPPASSPVPTAAPTPVAATPAPTAGNGAGNGEGNDGGGGGGCVQASPSASLLLLLGLLVHFGVRRFSRARRA